MCLRRYQVLRPPSQWALRISTALTRKCPMSYRKCEEPPEDLGSHDCFFRQKMSFACVKSRR